MRSLTFSQWRDLSGMRELGSFNNCTGKRVLDVLTVEAAVSGGDCNILTF